MSEGWPNLEPGKDFVHDSRLRRLRFDSAGLDSSVRPLSPFSEIRAQYLRVIADPNVDRANKLYIEKLLARLDKAEMEILMREPPIIKMRMDHIPTDLLIAQADREIEGLKFWERKWWKWWTWFT